MITHYLKVAFRNLLKYKTQNLISIVGLAVGLFCFCICFYISRFVGCVDKCFENYERIADIYVTDEKGEIWSGVSGKMLPHLQQRTWNGVEGFTLLSFVEKGEYNLIGKNDELLPYELTAMETDSFYNKVFTPTLICGNWEEVANNRNSMVLTRHAAKRMFGNESHAIGKQFTSHNRYIRGTTTYTVRAVIEDLPENTSMNFMCTVDLLKVNDDGGYEAFPTPDFTGYYIYALLNENYSAQQLNEAFNQAKYTFRMFGGDNTICSRPLGKDFNNSQMANMMAAIANEGYYITPHLNKSDSMLLKRHETSVSPKHFSVVKEGMCRVFEYGTGRWHKIDSVAMGGKTGTAQNPHGKDHSLFIGFAPKENPQIAVAVVVENAGFGATWAAPIASLMMEQYLFGEIKRTQVFNNMCNTSTNSDVTRRP